MKKIKKVVLASALALSTLALPLTATQQVSAAVDHAAICKADTNCYSVSIFGMRVNGEGLHGYSNLVIKSGSDIVSVTPFKTLKAKKAGQAVVYAYDNSGKYIYFNIIVQ